MLFKPVQYVVDCYLRIKLWLRYRVEPGLEVAKQKLTMYHFLSRAGVPRNAWGIDRLVEQATTSDQVTATATLLYSNLVAQYGEEKAVRMMLRLNEAADATSYHDYSIMAQQEEMRLMILHLARRGKHQAASMLNMQLVNTHNQFQVDSLKFKIFQVMCKELGESGAREAMGLPPEDGLPSRYRDSKPTNATV